MGSWHPICEASASSWLSKLGFFFRQFSKGVYFDGHDRKDVVEDFIAKWWMMDELGPRCITNSRRTPVSSERPIVRILSRHFMQTPTSHIIGLTTGTVQILKQKSLGQAIMVSDFMRGGEIEEVTIKRVRGLLSYMVLQVIWYYEYLRGNTRIQ